MQDKFKVGDRVKFKGESGKFSYTGNISELDEAFCLIQTMGGGKNFLVDYEDVMIDTYDSEKDGWISG